MKRTLIVLVLAVSGLMTAATPAYADVTFFLGFSTTPETRPARGFAGGINFLLFGFEFDYANTSADEAAGAPNLKTGMINGLIMTPTKTSLKGIQKAAALLVAIGEQRASEIFKFLGDTEVEALSLELAKAQKIPTEVCRDVITEAVESVLAEDYLAEGGVDFARSVLMRSLGEDRADEIIRACPDNRGRVGLTAG